jgi:hypothetical protein
MIPVKPPPLIPCLDSPGRGRGLCQNEFRDLFEYLYIEGHWYATPPGKRISLKVTFLPHHFDHAFFKGATDGGPRIIWKPDRAERLLWIGYTLENPSKVYQVRNSRFNLFCRMTDRSAPWYLVVVDRTGEWVANFVTAYPLDHERIKDARKTGRLLGR